MKKEGSSEESIAKDAAEKGRWRRRVALFLGPLLFLLFLFLPAPEAVSSEAWWTAGIGLWMAAWWIGEAIPIPATALLPLVLFPLAGVRPVGEASAPYANPLIFLFLGGFLIAAAVQRWELHRRVALWIILLVGTRPRRIVLGTVIASAFLSMWVSNTATALMMLPIAASIIKLAEQQAESGQVRNFSIVLFLSIAYACNIGGIATLVGTPPNAFMAGFMLEREGMNIGFGEWMGIGLPFVLLALPFMFWLLLRLFPFGNREWEGGRELFRGELEALGPMSRPEKRTSGIFLLVAFLWIFSPLLGDLSEHLHDSSIAILGGVLLFLLPSGSEEGGRLLSWKDFDKVPWGILILFGGGLSLAAAISDTGLAQWIGQGVSGFEAWPFPLVILGVVAAMVFLTEITSNTATTAAFLPVLASAAEGMGQDPLSLVLPATVAASCAFMLPVATPPNAVVFSSGKIGMPEMSKAGFWLNLFVIALIVGYFVLWGRVQ